MTPEQADLVHQRDQTWAKLAEHLERFKRVASHGIREPDDVVAARLACSIIVCELDTRVLGLAE